MNTDRLMFVLSQEGFRPTLDERGGVRFNYEGGHYVIRVLADDPQYVAISYPNFWQLRSPEETVRAYRAANLASQAIKVAKVHVMESAKNVWAEVELLVDRPEGFDPLFARTLGILKAAVAHFVDLMKKSEPLPDARVMLGREDVTRWTHGN